MYKFTFTTPSISHILSNHPIYQTFKKEQNSCLKTTIIVLLLQFLSLVFLSKWYIIGSLVLLLMVQMVNIIVFYKNMKKAIIEHILVNTYLTENNNSGVGHMELTKIKRGDGVCMIEVWKNILDQTTQDCRLDGFCREVEEDSGVIWAVCEESDDDEFALQFEIYQEGKSYSDGTSVAMTMGDANKYFPIIGS